MVKTLQKKFIVASMLAVTILLVTLVGAINIIYCHSVIRREQNRLEMLCSTDGRPTGPEGLEPGMGPGGDRMDKTSDGSGTGSSMQTALQSEDMQEGGFRQEDSPQNGFSEDRQNRNGKGGLFEYGISMDEVLSSRFFMAWFDEDGQIIATDTAQIYAVTEEGAAELAQTIYALGKSKGLYQGFRYLIREKEITPDILARKQSAAEGSISALEEVQPSQEKNETGSILVAMDVSVERQDMLRILGISVLIAALCWLAMLIPVHLLARRAIAPTAMSIERQKQFVTDAGHELKTPLAIIQANTEALELYTGESKWTRNIRAQIVRLNGLMQNLLTLARMDENSLVLEKKSFAIDPLISEVWDNFAESAAGRKLSVQIGKEGDSERKVFANRETVAQILSILFDNAVKYTPRGGQIEIHTCSTADGVNIIQSNTVAAQEEGSPLSEDPERLFERFYRTDSARSRKKGGYGIGLSAARAIAGANNGSIHAQTAEGRIIFTVTLKKAHD